jgi:hypothetical protein
MTGWKFIDSSQRAMDQFSASNQMLNGRIGQEGFWRGSLTRVPVSTQNGSSSVCSASGFSSQYIT